MPSEGLTTSVAEEHWAFGIPVTVGTRREVFASGLNQEPQEVVGRRKVVAIPQLSQFPAKRKRFKFISAVDT